MTQRTSEARHPVKGATLKAPHAAGFQLHDVLERARRDKWKHGWLPGRGREGRAEAAQGLRAVRPCPVAPT